MGLLEVKMNHYNCTVVIFNLTREARSPFCAQAHHYFGVSGFMNHTIEFFTHRYDHLLEQECSWALMMTKKSNS